MSEWYVEQAEFDPARAISWAIEEWLQREIDSSMSADGRNAYLDNWEVFWGDMSLPFDDPGNQDAAKARSHYDRLNVSTLTAEQYPELSQDERFLARQLFFSLMFVSGAFRKQCFLQATSAEEYA